jgi:hypothetical protein
MVPSVSNLHGARWTANPKSKIQEASQRGRIIFVAKGSVIEKQKLTRKNRKKI